MVKDLGIRSGNLNPIVGVSVDAHPAVRVAAYAEAPWSAIPRNPPDRSARRADV